VIKNTYIVGFVYVFLLVMAPPSVVVLTLEQHKDGIWITQLAEALSKDALVSILSVESLLANMDPCSAQLAFSSACLIINRVSDAAAPHLQKACMGILQLATTVYKIPVWNGPASYSLCCNKWCHHSLFSKAGLESPTTRVLLNATTETLQEAISKLRRKKDSASILLKPNAGGFGAGVQHIDSNSIVTEETLNKTVSNYADHMTLVQDYVKADSTYRVWFLCGEVQCGIVRNNVVGENEFKSACMANTCTQPQTPAAAVRAHKVPREVQTELKEQLLPLLPDAHSGSVEFLYNNQGKRLYFDLNLLSTLPLVERVENTEAVWGRDYDPWKEMAKAMMDMILAPG